MNRTRLFALVLLFVTPVAIAQDRKPQKEESFMKRKLAAAQKLLGAMAVNDFTSIKENASILNDLSKLAAWKLVETPRYESYSDEFQRITLKMANQAEKKDLDAVALSYVDMTLTCVKCHQHVREQKIGMTPPLRLRGDAVER